MAYAITLRLDASAAPLVVSMWNELAARGVSDDAMQLGYPPHLTLAVLPDHTNPDRLLTAAHDADSEVSPEAAAEAIVAWMAELIGAG